MPGAAKRLDVERALTACVVYGSSYKAAEKTGYKARTIRSWQHRHPELWEKIKTERAAIIDKACVDEFRQLALEASQASQLAVELEYARLQAGEVRDAAGSARNLATTAAIATDKIALMEGRPTSIVEHRSGEEVLKQLDRNGYVDTTAEELDAPEHPTDAATGRSDLPLLPECALPNAHENRSQEPANGS